MAKRFIEYHHSRFLVDTGISKTQTEEMIKVVAFDWNGTIFADTQAVLDADNAVLKILGRKTITLKKLQETFDVPILAYYKNLGFTQEEFLQNHDQISYHFHAHYESRVEKCRTRQNSRIVLEWLSQNNINSLILSNHITDQIEKQLKRLKLSHYFTEVIANQHRKVVQTQLTKKEKLAEYVKSRKIKFSEILIVGDGLEEILIAKELGSTSVAVTQGSYSATRLKSAKPDFLVNDLDEIIKIVERINS